MVEYKFEPQLLYNVDQAGVTTVPETKKIIAPKGRNVLDLDGPRMHICGC